jgi:glycosyltransferase involved in cell wall biosynthesis
MKILALTENYPPDMSGGSVYAFEIPKRMAKHGVKTLVVTRKASVKHSDKNDSHVSIMRIDVPFYKTAGGAVSSKRMKFALTIAKTALRHHKDYDVIHIYSGQSPQIAGWMLKKIFRIKTPIAMTYMGTFIGYWKQLKPFPIHNIYDAASKLLIMGANYDKYFSVDDGTGATKVLLENGISSSKIIPHYQPVDINLFKPKTIKKDYPVIGYVGRLDPFKGVDILIRAVAKVSERIPNIKVLLIGDGPSRKQLEQLVAELNLVKNVKFLGNVVHEKTVKYFNLVDCLVFSDIRAFKQRKLLNLTMCEAMACGTLCLSSSSPRKEWGVKTWVQLEKPDPAELSEKLIDVFENPAKYKQFKINAREVAVKYFDWDKIINLYLREFKKLKSRIE